MEDAPGPEQDDHEGCAATLAAVRAAARRLEALPHSRAAQALPFACVLLLLAACHLGAGAGLLGLLACLAIGGWCQAALSFVGHDCSHGAFSRSPRVNRWVGRLVFAHCFTSFHGFSAMHRGHHRHTGFDEDPSGDSPALTRRANLLTYVLFVLLPLGFPLFAILPGWLAAAGFQPAVYPPELRPHVRRDLGALLALHVLYATLLGPAGYAVYLGAFAAGVWIVTQVLAFNHVGARSHTSCGLCNTRSVDCHPWLQRLLLFGGWHVEHHLVPHLPWYRMPALHRVLEEHGGAPHVSPGFLSLHLRVLRGHGERALAALGLRPAPPAAPPAPSK